MFFYTCQWMLIKTVLFFYIHVEYLSDSWECNNCTSTCIDDLLYIPVCTEDYCKGLCRNAESMQCSSLNSCPHCAGTQQISISFWLQDQLNILYLLVWCSNPEVWDRKLIIKTEVHLCLKTLSKSGTFYNVC